jgi:hypothetical protein
LAESPKLANLRFLSIGNVRLGDVSLFQKFLEKNSNIKTLDISQSSGLFLTVLSKMIDYPLTALYMRECHFMRGHFHLLLDIVSHSQTLKSIDVSGADISCDEAGSLIGAMGSNANVSRLEIRLDRLGIGGAGMFPILRGFLGSDLTKWRSISLGNNGLSGGDLRTIAALFGRMNNLEEISLFSNFTAEMPFISDNLLSLTKIPKLKSLNIAGDASHRLERQLLPLLDAVLRTDNLTALDITGNNCNECASSLANLIVHSTKLRKLCCDDNGFSSDQIAILVRAIETSHRLTSFTFPIHDCQRMAASHPESDEELTRFLATLQISAVAAINRNVKQKSLITDPTLTRTREIADLIQEIAYGV